MGDLHHRPLPRASSGRPAPALWLLACLFVVALASCGDDAEPGIQGDPTVPVPAPGPAPPPGQAEQ